MPDLAKYRKTIVAVIGAAVGWSDQVISSPTAHITAPEWRLGGILLAAALGVYGLANKP